MSGHPRQQCFRTNVCENHPRAELLTFEFLFYSFADKIEDLDLNNVLGVFESNILQMIAVSKFAVPLMERGAEIINTTSVVACSGNPRLRDFVFLHLTFHGLIEHSLSRPGFYKGCDCFFYALACSTAPSTRHPRQHGRSWASHDCTTGIVKVFQEDGKLRPWHTTNELRNLQNRSCVRVLGKPRSKLYDWTLHPRQQ